MQGGGCPGAESYIVYNFNGCLWGFHTNVLTLKCGNFILTKWLGNFLLTIRKAYSVPKTDMGNLFPCSIEVID